MEEIVHSNAKVLGRQIAIGPYPVILYFTGKDRIFTADTVLGRITASHQPRHTLGGPNGVSLENTIVVTIAFNAPTTFEDAILQISTLSDYFGLLVGRPQALLRVELQIKSDHEVPILLQVYWSMPPRREPNDHASNPQPSEVLLDAVGQPEEFSRVLVSWLERHQEWHDARMRFFNSFAKQGHYSIDRLISSANMFDILPGSAVPPDAQLTEELKTAKETGQRLFKSLSPCPERNSVLGALGRIGKGNLKQKINYRAQSVVDAVGERFPQLLDASDGAVNCRHYYVHGGERRFDYDGNPDVEGFLTDTLEFIFAASDLIQAGWNARAWSEQGSSLAHPFGRYRLGYAMRLQKLNALLRRPQNGTCVQTGK